MQESSLKSIAIIGGGPAGMILYKKLIQLKDGSYEIHIYERKNSLGSGMPYSQEGANQEHVTNIADSELKNIVTSIGEWIKSVPNTTLEEFGIDPENFQENKVLPRLLFGRYLEDQFSILLKSADRSRFKTRVFLNSPVVDLIDLEEDNCVAVQVEGKTPVKYDQVIICSGHNWPNELENTYPGYYESPYPPSKLAKTLNHPVAIRGSSLTAIDAIRTLARANGNFVQKETLEFELAETSPYFRIKVHTRNGLLPAIRFHFEDPLIDESSLMTAEEIQSHLDENNGFLSLDFMFEQNFKKPLREKDPDFYEGVKDLNLEQFVEKMMSLRERLDPISLFKAEFSESEKSHRRKKSVYWKEMLVGLSYALNYPAKYLSAEDMLRFQRSLAPLVSIVIASVPKTSVLELLALHQAGVLEIIEVGNESEVRPCEDGGIIYAYQNESGAAIEEHFQTFVDCIGQPRLAWDKLPFPSLVKEKKVSQAYIRFQKRENGERLMDEGNEAVVRFPSGEYYLKVPGLAINDYFQILDQFGVPNPRIFIMAVPYIGGYNPDYSGLDFCEEASNRIITLFEKPENV